MLTPPPIGTYPTISEIGRMSYAVVYPHNTSRTLFVLVTIPVAGKTIPRRHEEYVRAAIAPFVPAGKDIEIIGVSGQHLGSDILTLQKGSVLRLRAPLSLLPWIEKLANQRLSFGPSHFRHIRLGGLSVEVEPCFGVPDATQFGGSKRSV